MISARPRILIKVTFLKHFALDVWVGIHGHQKNQKIGSFIYFLLKKRGFIIYLAVLKRGLFGTNIRTMSYEGSYPPPTPTRAQNTYSNNTIKKSKRLSFPQQLQRKPRTPPQNKDSTQWEQTLHVLSIVCVKSSPVHNNHS